MFFVSTPIGVETGSAILRVAEHLSLQEGTIRMKIGAIKQITSELETHEFYIDAETDNEITYVNFDENIFIDFEITTRCPATLFPELLYRIKKDGIKKDPSALRLTHYRIKLDNSWTFINTEMIILDKKIPSAYFFTNKEELLAAAKEFTQSTIDDVLPCLKNILENAVFCTKQMYEKLSENPRETAKSFAETFHLPITDIEGSAASLSSFLDQVIPVDMAKRGEAFVQNEDIIVGAAAYLGEAAIRELPGYWEWLYNIPLPHQYDEVEKDVFVAVSSEFENRYFCPLYTLEDHWNFYRKVSAMGLDHFIAPW